MKNCNMRVTYRRGKFPARYFYGLLIEYVVSAIQICPPVTVKSDPSGWFSPSRKPFEISLGPRAQQIVRIGEIGSIIGLAGRCAVVIGVFLLKTEHIRIAKDDIASRQNPLCLHRPYFTVIHPRLAAAK
jgi:hypothetical protein